MKFFVGLHQPSDAQHFARCMISINRLQTRVSDFVVRDWMLDSGAFTTVNKYGGFPDSPLRYAERASRWTETGNLLAVVSQDWMCEDHVLAKTGKSVVEHQALTIDRYDVIASALPHTYVLPVLQGWHPEEYASHVEQYGERLRPGAWVGVGSVCKRNANPAVIASILRTIRDQRPDLQLHGFGLKITALRNRPIVDMLATADSMAWSYAARMHPERNQNDWREARDFVERIEAVCD